MGIKRKFDKLFSQLKSVEDLVQQVTVVGKGKNVLKKLKSIKKQCNRIVFQKVSVGQSAYETSLQPVPITGQSRLIVVYPVGTVISRRRSCYIDNHCVFHEHIIDVYAMYKGCK